jgi:hypothetical protein
VSPILKSPCRGYLGGFWKAVWTPLAKTNLKLEDTAQPLAQAKETASNIEDLATITHRKDPESEETPEGTPEGHSSPAPGNVAPVSHHVAGSTETSSLPIAQNDGPATQEPPDSEVAEAPSVAALSVDTQEQDDDSALGNTSI